MTRAAWLLLPTAVFALGCPPPPSLGDDAGVDAGVSAVELCQRLATSTCALRIRCYPAFTRLALDECVSQTQASCLAEYEALRPAFERATLSIDDTQLATCERRLGSSACPPSFPPDSVTADALQPFADCTLSTGLLRGAATTGATCDFPVECAAGTFCVKPGGVCRGTCATLSALGAPCGIGCAAGLRCDGATCTYLKALDEACGSSAECEPELICLGSCRPRRKLGERCSVDFARLSVCEPGLACDVAPFVVGAAGTCVVPRDALAPCNFHWSCRAGLVCADLNWSGFPASAPLPGNCREPDTAQSNCPQTPYASYVGDQCAPGLTCSDSTCEALPTRGQSCTPSKRNCSGFDVHCKPTGAGDVGVCAGAPTIGERCAVRLDASRAVAVPCASGFCDTETTLQCRPPTRTVGSVCREAGECVTGRCVPQSDMTLRCAPAC